ncbi:MAG: four-helix bundle copper-binding protein [Leptospira sp.]|nr:four-helix bundle copper-binding protein [Leptospira sp.]NCS93667.1 four-helix bundle copper-binding protein [Leptospira sp.]
MTRKEFIAKSSAGIAAVSAISSLVAEESSHAGMTMKSKTKSKYAKAMMAAVHCKLEAEICLTHCIRELGAGDKTLLSCANATRETIAACEAFVQLASQESKFTSKMASLCEDICRACAKECKKHENHHQECKACMDSCLSCAKEMSKI